MVLKVTRTEIYKELVRYGNKSPHRLQNSAERETRVALPAEKTRRNRRRSAVTHHVTGLWAWLLHAHMGRDVWAESLSFFLEVLQ